MLAAILWTLVSHGITALNIEVFSRMTPPPGSRGGPLNPIYGSLIMTGIATLIGTPVGIMAGTLLAEYGYGMLHRLGDVIRFVNDILLSAPSIIIGLFVYELVVIRQGHFSAWAGALALALIVIPVVVRTTEDMLKLVPGSLREAAFALGTPKWKVVVTVSYRAALQGMITGVMLAVVWRDRAAVVHRTQQPVLDHRIWLADGESAGRDLPVCNESL